MMMKTAFPAAPLGLQLFLQTLKWMTARLGVDVPPIVDMNYLRSLPPNTLGRCWADHLIANGLQPFTTGPRRQQLHDGVHVLTGYGTDPLGEAEVQAFLLGAKFRVIHGVLMAGLLYGIHRQRRWRQLPMSRAAVRSRLQAAYQRGQQAGFDPDSWRPEDQWQQPLAAIQAALGLAGRSLCR